MDVQLGFISIGVMLFLLTLRMPIGLALMAVSLVGLYIMRGTNVMMGSARIVPYEFIAHWTLSAIPMFLFMGAIASNAGMVGLLFKAIKLWVGKLPGGLAIATSFAGAGFAAVSGSSVATTAAMGRIAVPEMLRAGYNPGLATGVATAVGTVGALIPPSLIMIFYATFAEVSVGRMLMAGLVPGVLTAAAYAALVLVRCKINPDLAPTPKDIASVRMTEKLAALGPVWPIPVLAMGMIGAIYAGYATVTEAAAAGAVMTLILVMIQRRLNLATLTLSLKQTVSTTASVLLIAIGASLMTQFLAYTGMPFYLSGMVTEFTSNPLTIMAMACLLYLVLGCFLDPLGVMLLTLPILLPVIKDAQIDEIWAGVIFVKMLEIGLLTPPIGLNAFVMKGAVGDRVSLGTIFKGTSWFLMAEVVIMAILLFFPKVSTWLPSLMIG
ncbi:TRAP transporter large permease [Maritimibacter fusiformis]|nr:TRAP transporter large permease [Maritimibacter fusiformis]